MVARMIIAYVLWLFLGGLGVHRFFLGRVKSGLLMLVLTLTAIALMVAALMPAVSEIAAIEDPSALEDPAVLENLPASPYLMPGVILFTFVSLWLLVDLILVALMVLKDAELAELKRQDSAMPVYAANMDPSFQATRHALDLDEHEERPRRNKLPDDYVMPWRRDDARGEQKMYRPDDE